MQFVERVVLMSETASGFNLVIEATTTDGLAIGPAIIVVSDFNTAVSVARDVFGPDWNGVLPGAQTSTTVPSTVGAHS